VILERAEIIIKDGEMGGFLEVIRSKALPLTDTFEGCHSFKVLKGVEEPNNVMFLALWESMEAHLTSREAPEHAEFRALVLPFAAGAKPTVHFEEV
jgi:quinol monooxygenase YgiN